MLSLIAVFGILTILVLEFGSFKGTLVVASVIPLGVIGGLAGLAMHALVVAMGGIG